MKIKDILSGGLASNPRKKQIASIFKEAGIIEKYGSGIKRVMQAMANAGSPAPVFETIADNFKITLFPISEIPGGGVNGGVSGGVNGGVNNFLNYIKTNPGKKSTEIKTALNLPQRTLERWLKELRVGDQTTLHGYPLKVVFACEENEVTVITAYPLKRGLKK